MGKSKNQQYAEKYSAQAMAQMERHGIPASIILAQGILESANGDSQLARKENNHFGVKASSSWLANGGKYGLYSDDKPNEKFCHYDSVEQSFEHHSTILKESKRYSECFKCDATDYEGWARALEKAGYATSPGYADKLIAIIERNNLQQYDQQVIESISTRKKYSFPLEREEFLHVTSPFGNRKDPTDQSKTQMHKGIDIRTNGEPVMATEDGGKVVAINENPSTAGGKSVTIEYTREDGTKVQTSYLHLNSIDVKAGETVSAGQKVGISGNTGTHTTGAHLHFSVSQIDVDGTKRVIDPAAYLAEIGQKGGISLTLLHNGENLMAKYQLPVDTPLEENLLAQSQETPMESQAEKEMQGMEIDSLTPEEWLKKLMTSSDSGMALGPGEDPIVGLMATLFSALMMMAGEIDRKSEREKFEMATAVAESGRIDLTPIMPGFKECYLETIDGHKAVLTANVGETMIRHTMTSIELYKMNEALKNTAYGDEDKRLCIAGIVSNAIATEQSSMNYDMALNSEQSQSLSVR